MNANLTAGNLLVINWRDSSELSKSKASQPGGIRRWECTLKVGIGWRESQIPRLALPRILFVPSTEAFSVLLTYFDFVSPLFVHFKILGKCKLIESYRHESSSNSPTMAVPSLTPDPQLA